MAGQFLSFALDRQVETATQRSEIRTPGCRIERLGKAQDGRKALEEALCCFLAREKRMILRQVLGASRDPQPSALPSYSSS
jgi:hypothetical protein